MIKKCSLDDARSFGAFQFQSGGFWSWEQQDFLVFVAGYMYGVNFMSPPNTPKTPEHCLQFAFGFWEQWKKDQERKNEQANT